MIPALDRTASSHVAFPGTMVEATFLRLRTTCPFCSARASSAPAFALPTPMHSLLLGKDEDLVTFPDRIVNEIESGPEARSCPGRG